MFWVELYFRLLKKYLFNVVVAANAESDSMHSRADGAVRMQHAANAIQL